MIGALSVYWIHIKMNVRFQSLLRLGIGLNFPLSLIYVSVIYVATVAVILWAGLAIYLAVTGGFSFRRLFRGLSVILLVVVPSLVAGMFLKGLLLPPVVKYMTLWLPLFLALWLSIWVGLPRRQRNVRFGPKAVE
jgi:hypothetical protein